MTEEDTCHQPLGSTHAHTGQGYQQDKVKFELVLNTQIILEKQTWEFIFCLKILT